MELKKEGLIKIYRCMVLVRRVDEAHVAALASGKIPSFYHSGQGNEATAVAGSIFLRKNDWVLGATRAHGSAQYIAKGMSPKAIYAEHCSKATGCCGGWTGFHSADSEVNIPGVCGTLGFTFPLALGLGMACKVKKQDQVVVAYFGDGASNRGTLHESFNMASLWKLPIVWVCENNGMAVFTHVSDHYAGKDIADLAYGYAMPGVVIDGQDAIAVAEAVMLAVDRARAGDGPTLVECKTLRFRSHGEGIPNLLGTIPVSEEELEEMKKRDPITLMQNNLIQKGILTRQMIAQIDSEIDAEIQEMEKFVDESPMPDPNLMFSSLYAE